MQSPAVSRCRHLTVCDGVSVCASAIVQDISQHYPGDFFSVIAVIHFSPLPCSDSLRVLVLKRDVGHASVPVLSVLSFPTLVLSAGVENHWTLRELPPLTANTSIPGIEDLSFTQGRTGREIECWLYQCMWTVSKVLRQLRATQRGFTRRGLGVKTEVS